MWHENPTTKVGPAVTKLESRLSTRQDILHITSACTELRQTMISPVGSSRKWMLPASAHRPITAGLTETNTVASSSETIRRPHSRHHSCRRSDLLMTHVSCVSIVVLVTRFRLRNSGLSAPTVRTKMGPLISRPRVISRIPGLAHAYTLTVTRSRL